MVYVVRNSIFLIEGIFKGPTNDALQSAQGSPKTLLCHCSNIN